MKSKLSFFSLCSPLRFTFEESSIFICCYLINYLISYLINVSFCFNFIFYYDISIYHISYIAFHNLLFIRNDIPLIIKF